jgi:hypothetical protein
VTTASPTCLYGSSLFGTDELDELLASFGHGDPSGPVDSAAPRGGVLDRGRVRHAQVPHARAAGSGTRIGRTSEAPRRRHLLLADVEEAGLRSGHHGRGLPGHRCADEQALGHRLHRRLALDVLRLRGRTPAHPHAPAAQPLWALGPPQPPPSSFRRTDAQLRRHQPGVGQGIRHLRRPRRGHAAPPHGPVWLLDGTGAVKAEYADDYVAKGPRTAAADQRAQDRVDAFANVSPALDG